MSLAKTESSIHNYYLRAKPSLSKEHRPYTKIEPIWAEINKMATQKTTNEIRALIINADKDFEEVENKALNDYLHKIFQSCPLTEDVCTTNQCVECEVFKKSTKTTQKNRTPKAKLPR